MPRRKKNKKQVEVKKEQAPIASKSTSISSEELKQIMVAAILEAEEIKQTKIAQQYQKEKEEWSRLFGEEDYSEFQGLQRIKLELQCLARVIKKIITVKDREIKESFCSENMIKAIIIVIFLFAEYIAYFGTILFLLGVFYQLSGDAEGSKWLSVVWLAFGFFAFLGARLFRTIKIEIKKMENRDRLFALSGHIVAFVSMIIALVALFNS